MKHQDVVFTHEISDHDTPYVVLNIKKPKYEARFRWLRNEKYFNPNAYKSDFQTLPLNLVYSFDNPDDQISVLNKLICDCINDLAPLRKVKLTRPPAPWMNDPRTIYLQKKTEMLRNHSKDSQIDHNEYKESKQQLKKCIKDTKGSFLHKALSARQPKVVWKTVNQFSKNSTSELNMTHQL